MTSPVPATPRRPRLLRRTFGHWLGILVVWLVGSVVAICVVYTNVKPTYRSSSLLRVQPTVGDLYGVRDKDESLDGFLQTQVQLITSPNVLTAAGTNPKAVALPRIRTAVDVPQELRKVIDVAVVPGTYLIEVSMASPNSHECAVLVNAVVDAFLEANVEWSDGMTKTQIKNLETYRVDLKNQTDELEHQWKELVAKGDIDAQMLQDFKVDRPGASNPDQGAGKGSVTIEEFKKIRQDLFQVELELAQAEAWAAEVKRVAKAAPATPDPARIDQKIERRFKADPEVVDLAAKLKGAKDKLEDVRRAAAGPGEPAEQAARKHLEQLTAAYDQAWQDRSRAYREEIEGDYRAGSDLEQREAEHRVRFLRIRQATLTKAIDRVEITNKRQATDSVLISMILEERTSLKSMQEAIVRRLEQLRFESKGESRIRLVADAKPPGKPIADKRMQLIALTPVALFFLAFVPFLALEAWNGPPGHPIPAHEWPVEP